MDDLPPSGGIATTTFGFVQWTKSEATSESEERAYGYSYGSLERTIPPAGRTF